MYFQERYESIDKMFIIHDGYQQCHDRLTARIRRLNPKDAGIECQNPFSIDDISTVRPLNDKVSANEGRTETATSSDISLTVINTCMNTLVPLWP